MMRLITTKHGVIEQQFVQHWYDILEMTLQVLVRVDPLNGTNALTVRGECELLWCIEINLQGHYICLSC